MLRFDPAYAALAFLATVWGLAAATVHPPEPSADPAPGAIDLARAEAHVAAIASVPHMSGTPENAAVRDYLLGELRALGMEPRIQSGRVPASPYFRDLDWLEPDAGEAEDVERDASGRPLVPIENILMGISGTRGEGAVLLQAHYDSRPGSPGAADDATGVAAVLETLRLLLQDGPPPNDLIVHFDDGEELGLLGAKLFLAEHEWADDVRCVVNLEARGNAGTPIVFEVGRGSAPLVRALAASEVRPVMPSLAAAVYRRLPNDTSFSPFRDRGVPGVNIAFVGGASAYHRPHDTPENLSRSSLARMGEYALAATRVALEADLGELEREAEAFALAATSFNVGGGFVAVYPSHWAVPLLVPPLVLLGFLVVRAQRGGLPLGRGCVTAISIALAPFTASLLTWWLTRWIVGGASSLGFFESEPRGNYASATLGGFGALGAGMAAAVLLLGNLRGKLNEPREVVDAAAVVGALVCLPILVGLTLYLPEGAYLLGWPLLLALPALLMTVGVEQPSRLARVTALAGFAAAALILAPTFYLLLQVVSIRPTRIPLLAGVFSSLLATLFQPALRLGVPRAGRMPSLVAAGFAGVALALGGIAAARGL